MLVIATPDTLNVRKMVDIARTVNPRIESVVRTHSEEEAVLLEKENAGKVFLGEHELAVSMIQHVLDSYAVDPAAPVKAHSAFQEQRNGNNSTLQWHWVLYRFAR